VIVEGYLDVIVLHQAGFTNTVSPMGTALTEDQLRTLKRFTRRIVLALDADTAGEKATLRGLELPARLWTAPRKLPLMPAVCCVMKPACKPICGDDHPRRNGPR
jgi:DNA primase